MEDLLNIYRSIVLLCGVGLAVSTLEYWAIARRYRPDGVYPWKVLRLRVGAPFLSAIDGFHETAVRALLVVRGLALALVLAAPAGSLLFSAALGLLIVNILVLRWRTGFDQDGSDRMNTIVLFTLLLSVGPHSTPFILNAGLWFIALQSCLSYTTSGLVKLASPSWRRGDALYRIMGTKTYGIGAVARILHERRTLQFVLCWSVILMETLFPLGLVLPLPALWIVLGWGLLFHFLSAAVMGFNTFVWAFVATYPAIIFAASELRGGTVFIDIFPV